MAMFDSLQGKRFFTTLDLSSGYHHFSMDERDAEQKQVYRQEVVISGH